MPKYLYQFTITERKELVALIAAMSKLDPVIVMAVCEQESGWYQFATRYEPAFFARYIAQMQLSETEKHARAFSYGLMQVMGQVARELGFTGPSLAELTDPYTGIRYGCMKLRECFDRRNGQLEEALLLYNGGGNLKYAAEVMARMATYE